MFQNVITSTTITSSPIASIPAPIPIYPSLSPTTHLLITLLFTLFYGLLFCYAYWQLWLVYCLGYKRFSYQTAFLSLSLLFTSLRLLLFSFYIEGSSGTNRLYTWAYCLLIEAPIILQYFIFALITSFYSKVLYSAQCVTFSKKNLCVQAFLITSSIIFLLSNVVASSLVRQMNPTHEMDATEILFTDYLLVVARAVITDGLFLVLAIILSYCLFQLSYVDAARLVVDVQGMTYSHVKLIITCISLLFSLRAIYNIIALLAHWPGFPFNWVDVTEQVDFVSLTRGRTYVSFILVLFFYEIVPAFIVLYLFAIPSPIQTQKRCPLTCCTDLAYVCYHGIRSLCGKRVGPAEAENHISPAATENLSQDYNIYSRPDQLHIQIGTRSAVRSPCGSVLTTSLHSDHGRTNNRGPASLLSSLVSPKTGAANIIPPVIQQEKSYFIGSARPSAYPHGFTHSSSSHSMAYVVSPPRRSLLPPGIQKSSLLDYRISRHRKSISSVNEATPVSNKFPHLQQQLTCATSDPSTRVPSVVNLLPNPNVDNVQPLTDGASTEVSGGTTTSIYLRSESTITEQHEDEQSILPFA